MAFRSNHGILQYTTRIYHHIFHIGTRLCERCTRIRQTQGATNITYFAQSRQRGRGKVAGSCNVMEGVADLQETVTSKGHGVRGSGTLVFNNRMRAISDGGCPGRSPDCAPGKVGLFPYVERVTVTRTSNVNWQQVPSCSALHGGISNVHQRQLRHRSFFL
jgi:hypothetical protein